MISVKQAQALRLQCTKTLGMSEAQYKAVLARYGVASARKLAVGQYDELMGRLKTESGGRMWMPRPDKQLGLIFSLWGRLHAEGKVVCKDHSACFAWMRKYLQQPDGTLLFTPDQKSRCIERLKKWLSRE
ncbi:DUF1018 domain-containing protein [Candidatus Haliotispira prima]|uniref:DUF1018 domain-containing protein n=1 Tax=Candidatus Haliotispira prima TaxID=3034016 RepID=A0ABY8MIQ0_9SPIO|nr:DUF1018 domain-containing protein [Candidatus Haliotispira prima]